VQRKPRARGFFGVLAADEQSIYPPGVAVCTYGKVIERQWFRKEPLDRERVFGWIEAPYLIDAVTTDKCRFQHGNRLWEGFFRKAQDEFATWLEESGLTHRQPPRQATAVASLEREINEILRAIPELRVFGGRQRTVVPIINPDSPMQFTLGQAPEAGESRPPRDGGGGAAAEAALDATVPPETGVNPTATPGEGVPGETRERVVRSGVRLATDDRPQPGYEAYFDGATVVVYTGHPAYRRAERERTAAYHLLKCVALSVARYYVEEQAEEASGSTALDIVDRFFAAWGQQ
jgi:hypothetical protein